MSTRITRPGPGPTPSRTRPSSMVYVGPTSGSSKPPPSAMRHIDSPGLSTRELSDSSYDLNSPSSSHSPYTRSPSKRHSYGGPGERVYNDEPPALVRSPRRERTTPNRHRHSREISFSSSVIDGPPDPPATPHSPTRGSRSRSSSNAGGHGLPSPPGTNSEGGSSAKGSKKGSSVEDAIIRDVDADYRYADALNLRDRRHPSRLHDEEYEPDDEGEDTAKVRRSGDIGNQPAQRMKSLAERNRLVLDRIARLSPAPRTASPRIVNLPPRSSASSRFPESGSETERESVGASTRGSGKGSSNGRRTPGGRTTPPPQLRRRGRLSSAPSSPTKTRSRGQDDPGIGRKDSIRSPNVAAALAAVKNTRRGMPEEWKSSAPRHSRASMSEDFRSNDADEQDAFFGGINQKARGGSAESALTTRDNGLGSVRRPSTTIGRYHDEDDPVRRAQSALSRYTRNGSSDISRKAELLKESYATFQGQLARAPGLDEIEHNAIIRSAGDVTALAERYMDDMSRGASIALQEQVDAEIEGHASRAVDAWRQVGGDYRDGQRNAGALMDALSHLMLSVGRAIKTGAASDGYPEAPTRCSTSLSYTPSVSSTRRAEGRWEESPSAMHTRERIQTLPPQREPLRETAAITTTATTSRPRTRRPTISSVFPGTVAEPVLSKADSPPSARANSKGNGREEDRERTHAKSASAPSPKYANTRGLEVPAREEVLTRKRSGTIGRSASGFAGHAADRAAASVMRSASGR
ncbi:hypothetical protein CYLTODRAFT_448973 [Cylindrobasidium torrendii FP15055 ss-10]|uniref:Uncharacterized protein n=1 Tax=Cylindrobasidium torrendii FP15055 ss-10 TaxID=1314674 RepID=A0A0D7BUP0_9AGAR|nr:hypothetical protein CYLTODRAFT_448973 [Cylindrobasidium torrendii FP15055 ss-10]